MSCSTETDRIIRKYSYEPVISCLEAVCPFSGFKAHSLQTGVAVQFGPRSKLRKRANRFKARQLQSTMDVTDHRVLLLGTICVSPVSFLGLCRKGNPGSGAQRRRTGRVPCCKGLKKTRGESMLEEEAPCDRLPVDHGFIRIFTSQVMTVQV